MPSSNPSRCSRRSLVRTNLTIAALAAAVFVAEPAPGYAAETPRQTQVERNSEHVMPFSMDAAMHRFVPTVTGGIQTVIVHNGDSKQVVLVRSHLRKEAQAFARGDFTDPASIHGGTMPGLQAMHKGAKRISVRYSEVKNGAAITYATSDSALQSAIHAWFKAQVSDHGAHATMKM
jgi:hypothetical protein